MYVVKCLCLSLRALRLRMYRHNNFRPADQNPKSYKVLLRVFKNLLCLSLCFKLLEYQLMFTYEKSKPA